MDWSNFFAMGGYGLFVWSSYAITAALLVFNAALPWQRERSLRARLRCRKEDRK